jgi:hypothetical protein
MSKIEKVAGVITQGAPYDPKMFLTRNLPAIKFPRRRPQNRQISKGAEAVQGIVPQGAPFDPRLSTTGITPANVKSKKEEIDASIILKNALRDDITANRLGESMRLENKARNFKPIIDALNVLGVDQFVRAGDAPPAIANSIMRVIQAFLAGKSQNERIAGLPAIVEQIGDQLITLVASGQIPVAFIPEIINLVAAAPRFNNITEAESGQMADALRRRIPRFNQAAPPPPPVQVAQQPPPPANDPPPPYGFWQPPPAGFWQQPPFGGPPVYDPPPPYGGPPVYDPPPPYVAPPPPADSPEPTESEAESLGGYDELDLEDIPSDSESEDARAERDRLANLSANMEAAIAMVEWARMMQAPTLRDMYGIAHAIRDDDTISDETIATAIVLEVINPDWIDKLAAEIGEDSPIVANLRERAAERAAGNLPDAELINEAANKPPPEVDRTDPEYDNWAAAMRKRLANLKDVAPEPETESEAEAESESESAFETAQEDNARERITAIIDRLPKTGGRTVEEAIDMFLPDIKGNDEAIANVLDYLRAFREYGMIELENLINESPTRDQIVEAGRDIGGEPISRIRNQPFGVGQSFRVYSTKYGLTAINQDASLITLYSSTARTSKYGRDVDTPSFVAAVYYITGFPLPTIVGVEPRMSAQTLLELTTYFATGERGKTRNLRDFFAPRDSQRGPPDALNRMGELQKITQRGWGRLNRGQFNHVSKMLDMDLKRGAITRAQYNAGQRAIGRMVQKNRPT